MQNAGTSELAQELLTSKAGICSTDLVSSQHSYSSRTPPAIPDGSVRKHTRPCPGRTSTCNNKVLVSQMMSRMNTGADFGTE
jgi:hypothetical protein